MTLTRVGEWFTRWWGWAGSVVISCPLALAFGPVYGGAS
jgi:hypothetical protein